MKVGHHSAKFGDHRHCSSIFNGFRLPRDVARPRDQRLRNLMGKCRSIKSSSYQVWWQ